MPRGGAAALKLAYSFDNWDVPTVEDGNTLANVNVNSLFAVARPSVVCNVRAPYSGGSNFLRYYVPWPSVDIH